MNALLQLVVLTVLISFAGAGFVGQYVQNTQVGNVNGAAYYDTVNGIAWFMSSLSAASVGNVSVKVQATTLLYTGQYVSLATVQSNPAMSFFYALNGRLGYSRATTTTGGAWGTVVFPDPDPVNNVGMYTSLGVLSGGLPAIAYCNNGVGSGGVRFVVAAEATGLQPWTTPINVLLRANFSCSPSITLQICSGNPCISYYDAWTRTTYFVRANDALGASWPSSHVTVASVASGQMYPQLRVNPVTGFPQIALLRNGTQSVALATATAADGSSWVVRDGPASATVTALSMTHTTTNGFPVVVYARSDTQSVHMSVASDTAGTLWTTYLLSSGPILSDSVSVANIGGFCTAMWYDLIKQYLWARQMTDTAATQLSNQVVIVDGP